MQSAGGERPNSPTRDGDLWRFFALAYLITWALLGPWFFLFNRVWGRSIPWWGWLLVPLAFCGGYGPSLAAIFVSWRQEGRTAVAALLRSLTTWRVPYGWYLLVFAGPYGLATLAAIISGVPDFFARFRVGDSLQSVPLAIALALPFGPLGEELGWRGYALPRLVGKLGACLILVAGIVALACLRLDRGSTSGPTKG